MPSPRILTETSDNVLTITINRPERLNAADRATAAEVRDALQEAKHDDSVRAIVLTGVGRGFCTGADLASDPADQPEMSRTVRKTALYEYAQVTKLIDSVDKPVIAAVNGAAAGAGLSWALACDRRIAAESARLAAIFVRRGLVPDAGMSYFLPRLVGMARATDLMMTGRLVEAKEALALGLIDELHPDDVLADKAHAYAAKLASGASVAVELARRAARRSFEQTLDQAIEFETWGQSIVGQTEDVREGRLSFLEKRDPQFKGR